MVSQVNPCSCYLIFFFMGKLGAKFMRDDPEKIANFIVEEHGLEYGADKVIGEATAAYAMKDYYALSIWRDVKRILRERAQAVP